MWHDGKRQTKKRAIIFVKTFGGKYHVDVLLRLRYHGNAYKLISTHIFNVFSYNNSLQFHNNNGKEEGDLFNFYFIGMDTDSDKFVIQCSK